MIPHFVEFVQVVKQYLNKNPAGLHHFETRLDFNVIILSVVFQLFIH